MTGCCIINCKNRSEQGFRLFRLPEGEKNADRKIIWLEFINREDLPLRACICEVHFDESQFETMRADGRKLLKWNAIPGPVPQITSSNLNSRLDNCSTSPLRNKRNVSITTTNSNLNLDNSSMSPPHKKKRNADDVDDDQCGFEVKERDFINNLQFEHLQNKLKYAQEKINRLGNKIKRFEEKCSQMFNPDQILYLENGGCHRGVEWSDETINKSLRLYKVCGAKGYKELKNQNLPFPSIRTLQHRIRGMKVKPEPGVLEGAFSLLELKVASFEHPEKEASILIDEIAVQSGIS